MKLLSLLVALSLAGPPAAASERGREFVTSCTYGAMAGTLVGAASLAFTDHPGDNLNRVARGASLGLYAGILLGVYVAWVIPALAHRRGLEDAADPALKLWPHVAAAGTVDGVEGNLRVLSF